MGIEIVKASVVYGRHLSGNAYKVLVAMSLSALDKPSNGRPANLYWGGWDSLAVVLGHPDATRNSSGHKAVKRAVRELRDGGHVTALLDAHRGVAQSYMVHPGGPGKGGQNDPVKGDQIDPVKGGQNGPHSGVKMTPPRSNEEVLGLNRDIELIQQPQPQEAGQDAEADEIRGHAFKGQPGSDCLICDKGSANRRMHPIHLLWSSSEGA